MIFALAAARQEGVPVSAAAPQYMVAMALSNQMGAAYPQNDTSLAENRVMRASFQWTNPGNSGSSIRFMPLTNSSY